MDTADRVAYLARIGYRGAIDPSPALLADLQLAHLLTVPFENLSIHTGEDIRLHPDWLFDKVVRRRRGGFCYELNGLFAELLVDLGFPVERLAARVFRDDGSLGIAFDHLCLRVTAGGQAWLVDVGFGDSFTAPLALDDPRDQDDGRRRYRIEPEGDERILWAGTRRSYRFGLTPLALGDFEPGRRYHTTSPESPFTARRLITLLTPDGRVTLRDDRLIVTTGDDKRDEPVADPADWRRLAAARFGIDLDRG